MAKLQHQPGNQRIGDHKRRNHQPTPPRGLYPRRKQPLQRAAKTEGKQLQGQQHQNKKHTTHISFPIIKAADSNTRQRQEKC